MPLSQTGNNTLPPPAVCSYSGLPAPAGRGVPARLISQRPFATAAQQLSDGSAAGPLPCTDHQCHQGAKHYIRPAWRSIAGKELNTLSKSRSSITDLPPGPGYSLA
ncbi:hypothetical protein KIL84_005938 [Mauremys mutica]|uniref:Uncharacterized protein n=1 Tax=Mauremys mutica TaxID=74926 RepID=A0A9D3XIC7_9SAUR|nr:hypothetical protein KIL84_005938 [Mauremys mutica]